MQKRILALRWLGIAIAAGLASACASAARPGNMVVSAGVLATPPADFALAQALQVASVSGGKGTNPLWKSQIGNPEFRSALEKSLLGAGLLAPTAERVKYLLNAELVKVQQPHFGFSFTVTMTVNYSLKEAATGRLVWRDTVAGSYTAKFSDALTGAMRLRLANEGAARTSIKLLVDSLYLLKLGG